MIRNHVTSFHGSSSDGVHGRLSLVPVESYNVFYQNGKHPKIR